MENVKEWVSCASPKVTKAEERSFIYGSRISKNFTVGKICNKSADVITHFLSYQIVLN